MVLRGGGVCFNHNPVKKRDETDEAGSVVSYLSWVPDQGTKLVSADPQGGGAGPGCLPRHKDL